MHEGQICSLAVSKAVKAKSSIPKGKHIVTKLAITLNTDLSSLLKSHWNLEIEMQNLYCCLND